MSLLEAATVTDGRLTGANPAFTGCGTDSRSIASGALFIALRGERFDGHDFIQSAADRGAAAALVDAPRPVPLPQLVVADTRAAMGRLAADWRARFRMPLLAVTGSNGKTTVKEMLAAVLSLHAPVLATRGNLNNDIGVPLTLFGLGAEHRYAVLEMGANHPGEILQLARLARADVALVTLVAPAHLEGFGSIEGVARAKAEIYQSLGTSGCAIINADDAFADLFRHSGNPGRRISFGIRHAAEVSARAIELAAGTGSRFTLVTPRGSAAVTLPLPGQHNIMNALAVAACCEALDIGPETVAHGLAALRPVKGRLERKTGRRDAVVIDDSYNANPASLGAALAVLGALPGRRWLVLGDMGELGSAAASLHHAAGEQARAAGVERLYALGELARAAVRGFGAGARHFPDHAALAAALAPELAPDVAVLVKGSRAMHMEQIVHAITGTEN